MNYEKARFRLLHLANLDFDNPDSATLADTLSSFDITNIELLQQQFEDFIQCIDVINDHLRTTSVSTADHIQLIDYQLVYAISVFVSSDSERILRLTMQNEQPVATITELARYLWRVATAWEALLAGDIESISEAVALEEKMRTFYT